MEPFDRSILGKAVKLSLILTLFLTLGFQFWNRMRDIPGLWAGILWIGANAWMIHRILRSVSVQTPEERKRVYKLAVIKFPVLYLTGLFLLLTPWVTLEGVFGAFTLFFISIGAVFAYTKFGKPKEA